MSNYPKTRSRTCLSYSDSFGFGPSYFLYAITHTLRVSPILLTLSQRKGRGEERVAKLQDSPDCPEREATYVITNGFVFSQMLSLALLKRILNVGNIIKRNQ